MSSPLVILPYNFPLVDELILGAAYILVRWYHAGWLTILPHLVLTSGKFSSLELLLSVSATYIRWPWTLCMISLPQLTLLTCSTMPNQWFHFPMSWLLQRDNRCNDTVINSASSWLISLIWAQVVITAWTLYGILNGQSSLKGSLTLSITNSPSWIFRSLLAVLSYWTYWLDCTFMIFCLANWRAYPSSLNSDLP